jgi:hypothetical protein
MHCISEARWRGAEIRKPVTTLCGKCAAPVVIEGEKRPRLDAFVLDAFHEVRHLYAERVCQGLQGRDGDVGLAALDLAYVRGIQTRALRELHLRQSRFLPEFADIQPNLAIDRLHQPECVGMLLTGKLVITMIG